MKLEELIGLAEDIDAKLFGEKRSEDLLVYLREEVKELEQATKIINFYSEDHTARFNQIEELGDVLFCLIAFARQNNIDLREALSTNLSKLRDRLKNKEK